MSEPRKFRKKPVMIEAVQWTGTNWKECYDFCRNSAGLPLIAGPHPNDDIHIMTLEDGKGTEWQVQHIASRYDWIIKGVKGEFYPCKPDIFEATYEPAD